MKALILAAGFGKRLRPLTKACPKSLVEVNGTPLLINALNNLVDLGVNEIGIVVGHMADMIRTRVGNVYRGISVHYFENTEYLETNNIYSLYKAISFCDDDMLLLECDLFYHKEMLLPLMNSMADCTILVSPFDPITMDGTVIRVEGNTAKELIIGKWQNDTTDYSDKRKTVNIYRFSKNCAQKLMALIDWYVQYMGKNSYYEKVLGALMYLRECDIRIAEVPASMWCEIDDAEDLRRAQLVFGRTNE